MHACQWLCGHICYHTIIYKKKRSHRTGDISHSIPGMALSSSDKKPAATDTRFNHENSYWVPAHVGTRSITIATYGHRWMHSHLIGVLTYVNVAIELKFQEISKTLAVCSGIIYLCVESMYMFGQPTSAGPAACHMPNATRPTVTALSSHTQNSCTISVKNFALKLFVCDFWQWRRQRTLNNRQKLDTLTNWILA